VARRDVERALTPARPSLPGETIELAQGVQAVADRAELGFDTQQGEGDIVERGVLDRLDHLFAADFAAHRHAARARPRSAPRAAWRVRGSGGAAELGIGYPWA